MSENGGERPFVPPADVMAVDLVRAAEARGPWFLHVTMGVGSAVVTVALDPGMGMQFGNALLAGAATAVERTRAETVAREKAFRGEG